MNTATEILIGGTGLYEVLSRVIPTKRNHSLLHGILNTLLFLSNLLNRQKRTANEKAEQ